MPVQSPSSQPSDDSSGEAKVELHTPDFLLHEFICSSPFQSTHVVGI